MARIISRCLAYRDAVNIAVEQRRPQVRDLWDAMLRSIGVAEKAA
jgi:hypothetical protein